MAKRDRFIKKKIEEWIQKNGEPEIGEREKLVERFINEYFKEVRDGTASSHYYSRKNFGAII